MDICILYCLPDIPELVLAPFGINSNGWHWIDIEAAKSEKGATMTIRKRYRLIPF